MIELKFSKHIFNLLILSFTTFIFMIILFCFFTNPKINPKACNGDDDKVDLPIIMYHGITQNKTHENKFIINSKLFEDDIKYLTENGFNTITVKNLLDFVYEENKKLPEKSIMLTFDDGYLNNYTYAFPILKKYNCKIVLSPIGKFVDFYSEISDRNINYACINWNDVKEMVNSELVEIQNHSYDMHENKKTKRYGCKIKKKESLEQYEDFISKDLMKVQEAAKSHNIPEPTTFTYPFGAISCECEEIIKKLGFKASFSCAGKINHINKYDFDSLYLMGRFLRPPRVSSEHFFNKILK